MLPRQTAPHPLLQPYIKCLWRAERDFSGLQEGFLILPDAYVELIVSFGAPCRLEDGETLRELPRAYLVGLLDRPLRVFADGVVTTYGVRFYAWGFRPLMGYLVNKPVNTQQLDADLVRLGASLDPLAPGDAVMKALEAFLLARNEPLPRKVYEPLRRSLRVRMRQRLRTWRQKRICHAASSSAASPPRSACHPKHWR